jgi:hypothetical protein
MIYIEVVKKGLKQLSMSITNTFFFHILVLNLVLSPFSFFFCLYTASKVSFSFGCEYTLGCNGSDCSQHLKQGTKHIAKLSLFMMSITISNCSSYIYNNTCQPLYQPLLD